MYSDLRNYYTLMFSLVHHHKYSLTELENMIPFEMNLYVDMLIKHIEELKKDQ